MNIAIVGATGNVGRKLLEVIGRLKFPSLANYILLLPIKVLGKKINFSR